MVRSHSRIVTSDFMIRAVNVSGVLYTEVLRLLQEAEI